MTSPTITLYHTAILKLPVKTTSSALPQAWVLFFKDIKASNLFSAELLAKIEQCERECEIYFQKLQSKEISEKTLQVLSNFLLDVIYLALVNKNDSAHRKILIDFQRAFEELIRTDFSLDLFKSCIFEIIIFRLKELSTKLSPSEILLKFQSDIQEWNSTFSSSFSSIQDPTSFENISIGLYILLANIIYPAFTSTNIIEEQEQLVLLINEIRIILQFLLSSQIDIDQFINKLGAFDLEGQIFKIELIKIRVFFYQKIQSLVNLGNEKNQHLLSHFENIKKQILEMTQNLQLRTHKTYEQIDNLNQKVEEISKQLIEDASNAQDLSERMIKHHQKLNHLITDFKEMLEKILS